MTWPAAHSTKAEPGVSHPRTPVEYLRQEEAACPLHHPARPSYGTQAEWQSFSLGGHRLSSLYRVSKETVPRLISGKPIPASSWQKYSHLTLAKSAALGGIA